ncbi:granulocyte-macrophage colony-stimulating factor receptor subunit alpha-like [Suncus etruscus]|uniref:granulocyte-macrophage colony-stimulating factor receptor subunit alpha-like n=1 Tax=Suncus etruscus TaxID=109475 RepID=UPI0021102B6A|nr:granulocyte-macrophage colony-stimulating factor receptor subunit alpha-like [Suncus etruscus]
MAVLLTLRLTAASTVTPESSGVPPLEPRTLESNLSLEVKFEPRTMRLWWECGDNASRLENLTCKMDHKSGPVILPYHAPGVCECRFQPETLHEGVLFTVNGTVRGRPVQGKFLYENPGAAQSAAGNLSCVIYGGRFLNCSWTRGPAAPRDAQYFLFLRFAKARLEVECPLYVPDSGTHLGCHFSNLTGFRTPMYFLVNGTSSGVGVRFFDAILSLKRIEIYDPPGNITASCNDTHCLLGWTRPKSRLSLGDRHFQYQLRMLRQGEPTEDPLVSPLVTPKHHPQISINIPGVDNPYILPCPEPRDGLQVQLRSCKNIMLPDDPWSVWSEPVCLGHKEQEVTVVFLYFLVVVGTLVCGCALMFVGHRFLVNSRICPPVPHVRDKVSDVHQQEKMGPLGEAPKLKPPVSTDFGVLPSQPKKVDWEDCLTGVKRTQSEQVLIVTAPETVLPLAESHFGDGLKGITP